MKYLVATLIHRSLDLLTTKQEKNAAHRLNMPGSLLSRRRDLFIRNGVLFDKQFIPSCD
jgi:hypothetical protein